MSVAAVQSAAIVAARVKRSANRRLRNLLDGDDPVPAPFVCECGDARCCRPVWLTSAAYDSTGHVLAHVAA